MSVRSASAKVGVVWEGGPGDKSMSVRSASAKVGVASGWGLGGGLGTGQEHVCQECIR